MSTHNLLKQSCWRALLHLNEAVKTSTSPLNSASIRFGDKEGASLNEFFSPPCSEKGKTAFILLDNHNRKQLSPKTDALFCLKDLSSLQLTNSSSLPREVIQMIKIYAPYCFSSRWGRKWKRSFTVCHMAQSLDGRIATVTGDSEGIGNEQNLIHAHRMRALLDAVLIGSKTLTRDRPKLTVRRVPGKNPVRVVLGSNVNGFGCLREADPHTIIHISPHSSNTEDKVKNINLTERGRFIPSRDILKALYTEGIMTVYIEGGGTTSSHFLKEDSIDVLQLHQAPIVIGSGAPAFKLPSIENITSSIRFHSHRYFPVNEGIMFIGTPKKLGLK